MLDVAQPVEMTVTTSGGVLNLRWQTNTNSTLIDKLQNGSTILVYDSMTVGGETWYQTYTTGSDGKRLTVWALGKYLTPKPIPVAPPTQTEPTAPIIVESTTVQPTAPAKANPIEMLGQLADIVIKLSETQQ
jgi:hypothetical protein